MDHYDRSNNQRQLFVHFDKNIYTTNENAWLTAYFLKDVYSEKHCFISVILIDNHNLVKIREKFIMIAGIASGKILLPDSLKDGSYNFMVYYGDLMNGTPAGVFIQPVTIRKPTDHYFKASLKPVTLKGRNIDRTENVQITLVSQDENSVSDVPVYYYIGNPVNQVFSGKLKTDKTGQCLVSTPSKYLTKNNHTLQIEVNHTGEIKYLTYVFPGFDDLLTARFYPEGGSLVEGFNNKVGWEVKDETGAPVKVTGVIYKNDLPVDTISTDRYGIGYFNFIPAITNRYYVRLPFSNDTNTRYQLPGISVTRPAIAISNAIVKDTLSLIIRNKKTANFHLLIHNYKQLFFSFPVSADATGKSIKIALTDLPKGIAEITLLDSLKRPCAERLFFAHADQTSKLIIKTNQHTYKTRKKVSLDIRLKDTDGKPLNGLVSIACVQANRLSANNSRRIDSYLYLMSQFEDLPLKDNYLSNDIGGKNFLETLLLIKGWRNYSWKELNLVPVTDSIIKKDSLILMGVVSRFNKPVKKSVPILMMKDGALSTIETFTTGKFSLSYEDLLVTAGKKIRLFVTVPRKEEYTINIADSFQQLLDSLSPRLIGGRPERLTKDYQAPADQIQFGGIINLAEVKVKSRNDHSFYGSAKKQNACGDYVCMYGFLNCPLHVNDPGNIAPVQGKLYKSYIGVNADEQEIFSQILYGGCEVKKYEYAKVVDGISYPVEFYAADYEKEPTGEPQFLSTIYWKNIYSLPIANEKPLEFFTGDITGEFKIIVQGVTDNDVIYGQQTFSVSE